MPRERIDAPEGVVTMEPHPTMPGAAYLVELNEKLAGTVVRAFTEQGQRWEYVVAGGPADFRLEPDPTYATPQGAARALVNLVAERRRYR